MALGKILTEKRAFGVLIFVLVFHLLFNSLISNFDKQILCV